MISEKDIRMVVMSVRLGTNDVAKARAFYNATFAVLGCEASVTPPTSMVALYRLPGGLVFIVGPARNGEPATYANGGTILLIAPDEAAVDAWHEAGIVAGGSSEGSPGPRGRGNDRYGAYLRDPDGNKLGCYVGSLFG